MKSFRTTLFALFMVLLMSPTTWSQQIDANRMNRDIKIMENILGEMFKTHMSSNRSSNTAVFYSEFSTGSSNAKGTYLPGYGLIFNIQNNSNFLVRSQGEESTYSFYYGSNGSEENTKVSEEAVVERMKEFLKDYASTIGQLKDDEHVMLIYGSGKNNRLRELVYITSDGKPSTKPKEETLPVISASATKKDLEAYRAGKLNSNAFNSRIKVASAQDREYMDLKVMSNIFETALREQGEESFRLTGGASYMMLDNFGAIFNLETMYRSSRNTFFPARTYSLSGGVVSVSSNEEKSDEVEEVEAKIQEAFETLKMNLKEYLVDYGRTVNSVKSDQYILATVTIRGRYNDIPERMDVQVKKSVLEQVDKGQLSRDAAIKQVIITEY